MLIKMIKATDRFLKDERSGLKIVKVRDHLIIYRHGEMKLWVDLELKYLVAWSIRTQAEVRSFNAVLKLVGIADHYQFIRSGRVVLLEAGGQFYRSEEYDGIFGPNSGNYRAKRPGDTA